jgi:glutathione S-transferase
MITVHHLENSRSQRVLWLLEELGIPYELKRYERDPKTNLAPASLKKVHPLGKSPVISDGDRVIAETGAIVDYIITRLGGGRMMPKSDTDESLRYTYWTHFAEGSLMPPLVMRLVFTTAGKKAPFLIRPIAKGIGAAVNKSYIGPAIEGALDLVEAELGKSEWMAGAELTAADVMMSFPLEAAGSRGGLGDRPRIKAWLQNIHARPAYKAALEKGGAYAYA